MTLPISERVLQGSDSRLPQYHRIRDHIREQIRTGSLRVGDSLPPERELQAHYGVSRTTIRAALQELVNQGLLDRAQGRGTTVARPRVYRDLGSLSTLSEDLTRQRNLDLEVTSDHVNKTFIAAASDVADELGVPVGSRICQITRRRMASGEPIAIDEAHFPEWVADLLTDQDIHSPSILEALERDHQMPLVEGRFNIIASSPTADIAALLELPPDVPLLTVTRTLYTKSMVAVDYGRMRYRADRVGYSAVVYRDTSLDRSSKGSA